MAGIYRRLLDRIEREPGARARAARLSLPGWEKGWVARAQPGGGRRRDGASSSSAAAWPGSRPRSSCADAGAQVTLLEARPRLGGATFSFERDGLWLDNGQHVFLRCCTAYLALLARLGVGRRGARCSRGSTMPVLAPGGRPAWLRATALPAPLHLGGALRALRPPLARASGCGGPRRARAARLDLDDPALDDAHVRRLARRARAVAAARSTRSGT